MVEDALRRIEFAGIPVQRAQREGALPESEAWEILGRYVPEKLPPGWQSEQVGDDGASYRNRRTGQAVIISVSREADGRRWVHVSTSFATRVPTYAELAEVKRLWIGDDRRAMQLFVERAKHVNLHPHTLHLWHCVDGDGLPDFTRGTGSV